MLAIYVHHLKRYLGSFHIRYKRKHILLLIVIKTYIRFKLRKRNIHFF